AAGIQERVGARLLGDDATQLAADLRGEGLELIRKGEDPLHVYRRVGDGRNIELGQLRAKTQLIVAGSFSYSLGIVERLHGRGEVAHFDGAGTYMQEHLTALTVRLQKRQHPGQQIAGGMLVL